MKRIKYILFGSGFRKFISFTIILVSGLLFLLFLFADQAYIWAGGIKGHPEYCEYTITPQKRVRLAVTPYAFPKRNDGHKVDPNNWRNDQFAHDFLAFGIIFIPYVDYEMTNDGGQTWNHFWRYTNVINEWAWCNAFDSFDETHFWLWSRTGIAITHDGGGSWIVGDGYKQWAKHRDVVIDYIQFDTPDDGRLVFTNWPNQPDPTLLTHDGGRTWSIDPAWQPPTQTP